MNNTRRDKLKKAVALLDDAEEIISGAQEEEQECLDNLPESLEGSERYEKMESAISMLEEAIENITNARDNLDEAMA